MLIQSLSLGRDDITFRRKWRKLLPTPHRWFHTPLCIYIIQVTFSLGNNSHISRGL